MRAYVKLTVGTKTEMQLRKEAREIFDQTGASVEVENKLGDTLFVITKSGKEIVY